MKKAVWQGKRYYHVRGPLCWQLPPGKMVRDRPIKLHEKRGEVRFHGYGETCERCVEPGKVMIIAAPLGLYPAGRADYDA